MMIFLDKSLVIFSTPKTGSTSLLEAFRPHADVVFKHNPGVKHIRPQVFWRHMSAGFLKFTDHLDSVAMVREPIDWLHSWYRYRSRENDPTLTKSVQGMSFNTFVEKYINQTDDPRTNLGSQFKFLCAKNGKPQVSELWQYESIDTFVHHLCERLDVSTALDHHNVSPKIEFELDPVLRTDLEIHLKKDYDLYNTARKTI